VGESVATADAVVLEPNTVGASVYLTRALVKQSLLSVEAIVAADLRAQLGVAMERAVMGGLNLAAAPAGIIDAVGVHKVTLTTADKPTWAQVVDLVSKVEGANVGYGAFGWALAPAMAGYLRANPKVSGDSAMMMTDMTLVAHKVAISSNVPTGLLAGPGLKFSGAIFGDWSSVVIGSWDGLDLQVDPYSAGRKGGIYLTALMDVDVGVKQPKAFALAYNP
jgi:HK97 family phage major capsid protein